MDNERSYKYALIKLLFMSLSLTVPLIMIGASSLIISLISLIVFVSALCGNVLIAYIYRVLQNIILRPGLYIWALIATIRGPQDFIAICFYIIFALQIINIIKNFIFEIILLCSKE
jgi:hypothetical protein